MSLKRAITSRGGGIERGWGGHLDREGEGEGEGGTLGQRGGGVERGEDGYSGHC